MNGIYLLLPTLFIIMVSYLVVRAGAIALMFTGMDERMARFQALSAFTRTGFTTREAEAVMSDPRRRRIVTWLIVLGNAGIVTVIVTATSSLTSASGGWLGINAGVLIVGLLALWVITRYTPLARVWERLIRKYVTRAEFSDRVSMENLLHLTEGFGLNRVIIAESSPLAGKSLNDVNTPDNEFWVLGIERGKDWLSLPQAREQIRPGDQVVVYGDLDHLKHVFGAAGKDSP